ncbi:CaiB/BaiF CoA transferase family protein [Ottowia thiooxydans]|uniref:CaiB/BaiF CoA transferase family protein n=1 Tax=Ottowia thiooxydans TaxID=219182 RepID=UPI00040EC18D|nr:CoA transferase [Ottowia thiooxydans]
MTTQQAASGAIDPPLQGLRVIEFGQYIAAPAAGQTLADLGADVIKIEPPGGDASRRVGWTGDDYGPMFSAYNRDKRSVMLDLRSSEGQRQAKRLALNADVVLSNSRPGALEKLGLGAEQLISEAPRLVYGRVSAFGQTGSASIRAGFDIAAQAESGMMSLNGEGDRDPVRVGFTVVDILAGQSLATGVLAALVRRGVTGRGALVDLSLIDVAVSALGNAWAEYRQLGLMPIRRGNGQPTVAPAADVLKTRDGMVVLSAYMDEHFIRLCKAIGQPELAKDARFSNNPARVSHRAELMDVLKKALSQFDSEALVAMLAEGGIVAGAIKDMSQVHAGQGGVSKDLFIDVHAAGRDPISVPGLAINLDGIRRQPGRLPALGEHTEQVLAEL